MGNSKDQANQLNSPPAQAAKKELLRIKKATVNDGLIMCCLCHDGRTFSSKKALCGHMRVHSERNWRGINPPESSSDFIVGQTDDDGDRQVDLTESLMSWSPETPRKRRTKRIEVFMQK
ncbi:hypothetical protein ACFE04_024825 [Oxalis oulophora]